MHESSPGRPKSEYRSAQHEGTPMSSPPKSLLRSILLVEDSPMEVDLTLQAFAETQVVNPVFTCRDGEEALAFMAAHAGPEDLSLPALVLLDLRLPKVDGLEVLRLARAHPVWRQVPFVALTTSREASDIARAYELGANSYIVKPMDFSAFIGVVNHVKAYWLQTNEPPFAQRTRSPP